MFDEPLSRHAYRRGSGLPVLVSCRSRRLIKFEGRKVEPSNCHPPQGIRKSSLIPERHVRSAQQIAFSQFI